MADVDPVVAAIRVVRERSRGDRDFAMALAATYGSVDCKDLYEFAKKYPEAVIAMAEAERDFDVTNSRQLGGRT